MANLTDQRKQRRASEPIAARIASDLLESCADVTGAGRTPDRLLQVLVVHQDFCAGLRAKQTLDDVRWQLNLGPCFHLSLWRVELLEDPGLRREALASAAHADIIFLALHGDRPLPPGLWHWFQQWTLGHLERPCVLVASFDERHRYSESARKVLETLHGVAAACGLEVIPHFDFTPADGGPALGMGWAWKGSVNGGGALNP
jgi:hypothetical protein